MERFGSYLKRKAERREALHEAFRIIDRNQGVLSASDSEVLRRHMLAAFLTGEINDVVNRHLGSDVIMTTLLGNPKRSRR